VEGEYSAIGGIQYEGTEHEVVIQQSVFTRRGTDRVLKYAFDLAQTRAAKHLTSATKSNGIIHSMPYWDSRVAEMAKSYPEVNVDQYHIDILTANFVRMPEHFDVVVGSNLFGDILTDIGAIITGSMGLALSGNIDPERRYPSMFEPVHGSAPDIAGKGIANPLALLMSATMLLNHLGETRADPSAKQAAARIKSAYDRALSEGATTGDLGGKLDTEGFADAVIERLVLLPDPAVAGVAVGLAALRPDGIGQ